MIIRKSSPTVFTNLEDGTAVLLNLSTFVYYSLNRTGSAIWQEIEKKESVDRGDLLKVIQERFEIDEPAASQDLDAFVGRLSDAGVVEKSS